VDASNRDFYMTVMAAVQHQLAVGVGKRAAAQHRQQWMLDDTITCSERKGLGDAAPDQLGRRAAGQRCSGRIHQTHHARGIGGNHGFTAAPDRHLQPLPLRERLPFRFAALLIQTVESMSAP
jgi:hypothetical protein